MNFPKVFQYRKDKLDTKDDLVRLVKKLHRKTSRSPYISKFDSELTSKYNLDNQNVWYTSQGEHWLGWLSGYSGSGAYGRKDPNRSPEFI